jgi:hypothetical protein
MGSAEREAQVLRFVDEVWNGRNYDAEGNSTVPRRAALDGPRRAVRRLRVGAITGLLSFWPSGVGTSRRPDSGVPESKP